MGQGTKLGHLRIQICLITSWGHLWDRSTSRLGSKGQHKRMLKWSKPWKRSSLWFERWIQVFLSYLIVGRTPDYQESQRYIISRITLVLGDKLPTLQQPTCCSHPTCHHLLWPPGIQHTTNCFPWLLPLTLQTPLMFPSTVSPVQTSPFTCHCATSEVAYTSNPSLPSTSKRAHLIHTTTCYTSEGANIPSRVSAHTRLLLKNW